MHRKTLLVDSVAAIQVEVVNGILSQANRTYLLVAKDADLLHRLERFV